MKVVTVYQAKGSTRKYYMSDMRAAMGKALRVMREHGVHEPEVTRHVPRLFRRVDAEYAALLAAKSQYASHVYVEWHHDVERFPGATDWVCVVIRDEGACV